MLKILYAADNRESSFYSMQRFVDTYSKFYQIKIAAHSRSIKHLSCDWNLDALLDFRGKYKNPSFQSDNFHQYVADIKEFAPDIILSDLEIYTSYIGLELGLKVWQFSPLLLYYGLVQKQNLYKYHSGLMHGASELYQYRNYILENSQKRLIASHLIDSPQPPSLLPAYQWVRPNFQLVATISPTIHGISSADCYYGQIAPPSQIDYRDLESLAVAATASPSPFTQINSQGKFISQYLQELLPA